MALILPVTGGGFIERGVRRIMCRTLSVFAQLMMTISPSQAVINTCASDETPVSDRA
jgi:hypothetical protein